MNPHALIRWLALLVLMALPSSALRAELSSNLSIRVFTVKGIVREIRPAEGAAVIQHEAIPGYMDAMTMPFKVKPPGELDRLQRGDVVSFRLHVTDTESWAEGITRTGKVRSEPSPAPSAAVQQARPSHPLLSYHFTNELAQPVALKDFRGQALAITFFFTRCPIPDYCPRLSKNFEEAAKKLAGRPGAPTNWHFLSISFDPRHDTPAVLKSYGEMYGYDPCHWSFLTGPADKIGELARLSDVTFEREGELFTHNFRTLIVDPAGRLQMVFPMGGDLSDAIVAQILKAVAVTNPPDGPGLAVVTGREAANHPADSLHH